MTPLRDPAANYTANRCRACDWALIKTARRGGYWICINPACRLGFKPAPPPPSEKKSA